MAESEVWIGFVLARKQPSARFNLVGLVVPQMNPAQYGNLTWGFSQGLQTVPQDPQAPWESTTQECPPLQLEMYVESWIFYVNAHG